MTITQGINPRFVLRLWLVGLRDPAGLNLAINAGGQFKVYHSGKGCSRNGLRLLLRARLSPELCGFRREPAACRLALKRAGPSPVRMRASTQTGRGVVGGQPHA